MLIDDNLIIIIIIIIIFIIIIIIIIDDNLITFTCKYTWASWTQARHWGSACGHSNSKVNTMIQIKFTRGLTCGHGPAHL